MLLPRATLERCNQTAMCVCMCVCFSTVIQDNPTNRPGVFFGIGCHVRVNLSAYIQVGSKYLYIYSSPALNKQSALAIYLLYVPEDLCLLSRMGEVELSIIPSLPQ